MDKGKKQDLDPNTKQDPSQQPSDDKTMTVSTNDWDQMKSTMNHMNNTVHNLSKKLEIANKKAKPAKLDNTNHQKTDDSDFTKKFNQLSKKYDDMHKQLTAHNNHQNVIKHAKSALKLNHMKVSPATLNHLLGSDNQSTDANINWFKPIYKKEYSHKTNFPRQSHHTNKKTTIGAQLAKDDKNSGTLRPLDDCFKN